MKWLWSIIAMLAMPVYGQVTNVTATIQDTSGQIWSNGSYTISFFPVPGKPGPYFYNGNPFTPQVYTGFMNGAGIMSISLPSNNFITPAGNLWTFTVCPLASSVCEAVNLSVTGSTLDLSSALSANNPPTSLFPTPMQFGYSDATVKPLPGIGQFYYNTTTLSPRIWNGTSWQPFGGGGGSTPGLPVGTNQFANATGNGFVSGGIVDTDQFMSGGGNNGVSNSLSLCTGISCYLYIPPTSTDTELATPLPSPLASLSSYITDDRGNSFGNYAYNPQTTNNINNQPAFVGSPGGQFMLHNGVTYTLPNPGPNMGGLQAYEGQVNNFIAPGYQCADSASLCTPQSGYTAAALWALSDGSYKVYNWMTQGITQAEAGIFTKYSIGDYASKYWYNILAGGAVTSADEGAYPGGGVQAHSTSNYICTVSTKTDANHMFCPVSSGASASTGGGRYLLDTNDPYVSQSQMGAITRPTSSAYGTVTFPNVTLPTPNAIGRVTTECDVPIQISGVATVTCPITVTSGLFDTTHVLATAANSNNWHNVSAQVTAASGLSGGVQNLTMTLRRSLPVGSFVFQGGIAGSVICLDGDDNFLGETSGNAEVWGSCFPVIGNPDAHTVAYANYQQSQLWASIPNQGSQALTMATQSSIAAGGFNLSNLTRDSAGNVTATFTSTSLGNRRLLVNGQKFFTINQSSGCTSGTVDAAGAGNTIAAYLSESDPTLQTVVFPTPITGAPTTCTSAFVFMLNVLADIYPAAEITDVADHTNPSLGSHGVMATTYFPAATVGKTLKSPPSYALAITGKFTDMAMATPDISSEGMRITLDSNSAYGNSAIALQNNPTVQNSIGTQGAATPSDAMQIFGQFGNTFNIFTPPPTGSAVLNLGFPSNNCALIHPANCPFFQNYDLVNIQSSTWREHWDQPTQTMSYFNFNSNLNGVPSSTFSPTLIADNIPHSFASAQFQGNNAGTLAVVSQIHPGDPFQGPSINMPPTYDMVLGTPVAVSSTVPAGGVNNDYTFGVQGPGGISFTPFLFFFAQISPITSGSNIISCSVVPTGLTAQLYHFNHGLQAVTGQTCTGPSGTVSDNGTYGTDSGSQNVYSAGAVLNSGGFAAQGFLGSYAFTQQDIFSVTTPATTITASINQSAAGVLSVNTTSVGNGLGSIHAAGGIGPSAAALWTSGSGAPSGACSNGSLYTSTTGTTVNILWACGGSAWVLVK